jgi:hypothetical protein
MKSKTSFKKVHHVPPYLVLTEEFSDLAQAVNYAESLGLWVNCTATHSFIKPSLYHKGYYNEN